MEKVCPKENPVERTVYFDYLRVCATIAVIILHVSAYNWDVTDVYGKAYFVFNFYDSVVRWGTPVFLMISGAIFLNRDLTIEKIYKKYILRMIVAFFSWALIYALFIKGNLYDRIKIVITGYYHMWFILMIIGIYMCIPFIKEITKQDNIAKYYLLLAIIFAFLVPEISMIFNDFKWGEYTEKFYKLIMSDISSMNMHIVLGYASYFVLGYMLDKHELSRMHRNIIYLLGLFGVAFTIIADLIVALKTGECCDHYYGSFNINVMFEACAIFVLLKYKSYNNRKLNELFRRISKYSFGIYLVHVLIRDQLNRVFGINSLTILDPITSVIVISLVVFFISLIISFIMNKIPLIRKYLV